jgi:hypothetical protein
MVEQKALANDKALMTRDMLQRKIVSLSNVGGITLTLFNMIYKE